MTTPDVLKAEQYFLAIANTTNDMIHLNDPAGRIIYANKATEKILGYSLSELINTQATGIIHPDDCERIKNDMLSVSAENQLPARDIRLLKKDGSYLDVEVRGFVVDFSEKKYVGAILRDISSRKRIEKELESYQNSLEELVEERTEKLNKALEEVKVLKGILPICSFCKKIRDDQGGWNQIEEYIKERSEADFSHSVCPECVKKHYPEFENSGD
ncbi:MAG: PAS domain S-box protein [Proteobacteria bacterium]|nr:PAS domain S-box protein [Pseudomonadota bacterium]MBU1057916.1 PAS domain S-box protein [Pseudomonadota bacterium]